MLLEKIKVFPKGKCVIVLIKWEGMLWSDYYKAKIYTTKPRKKVPEGEELETLCKKIISNNSKWEDRVTSGYTKTVEIKEHPELTILLKKIEKPKEDDSTTA